MVSILAGCFFFSFCVLNQVPQGGATHLIFLNQKWTLGCAAWGKTSVVCADFAKKGFNEDHTATYFNQVGLCGYLA